MPSTLTTPQQIDPNRMSVRPKKVVHVTAIDFTMAIFMKAQLVGLREGGYDVHTISSPGPLLNDLRQEGIVCHEVPISRSPDPRGIVRATRAMTALFRRHRFDVVHTHTPIASVSARVAARRCKVPHVFYTAHGFYFHEYMNPLLHRAHVALEKGLGRWTDHLLVQSREDLETALRRGIGRHGAASYLGNGVDAARFTPRLSASERAARRADLGLQPTDFVFAYVGRLVQEKGIGELITAVDIAAASDFPVRALLVGSNVTGDRDSFQSQIAARIQQRGLQDRFVFTGFTNDVPAYLELADAFVLPSYREGLPRSIIEAMHMALPVVSTDIRGPREQVVEGQTGFLVPARRADALAGAMERLMLAPEQARTMGAAGRRRALAEFCESQVVDRLLRVYEERL